MNTKALRQKILDLAIHGKLVPQDPNDEPASVLLERIRDEKERLIKEGKIKRPKKSKATSDKPHYENVPFEIPDGWCWTTIEDVCSKIGSGSTPKGSNYSKEGIPFFRSQNVQNDGIVLSDIKYISDEVHQSMIGTEVVANDLLLNITGGSLGRCAVVPRDFDIGNVSQHVCILRTVLVKPEYLHCFILSSFFSKSMKITGSGREGLPKYNLEKMLLPLPPIQEQERIIIEAKQLQNNIDKIDTCNGNLVELISQTKFKILDLAIHGKLVPQDPTDEPASELLKRINPKAEIISDNGHYQKLPEGWCMTNIGSLFDAVSAKRVLKSEWKDKGVPFYRAREIVQLSKEGFADKDLFISEKHYAEIKDKYGIPTYGDIMISAVGSIGYTYIVKEDDVFYYKDASVLCLKNTRHWNSKFFSIWLASPFLQEQMYKNSKGTTVDTITLEKIKEYAIPFPPLNEQHRIVAKIEEIFTQLDAIEASL